MDYAAKQPLEIAKQALLEAPALLAKWRKPGRPNSDKAQNQGYGWHELLSNEYAGSHASSTGLKLIVHPSFPMAEADRIQWVEEVALGVLKPFLESAVSTAIREEDKDRHLEAQHCTVKVANFLSACAAVGANKLFERVFLQLQPLAHQYVEALLRTHSDGGWGHWFNSTQAEMRRHFPTAAVFDALYRLARVDMEVEKKVASTMNSFIDETMKEFGKLLAEHDDQPPLFELWRLLPALRSVAGMDATRLGSVSVGFPTTQDNFERLFNAYIRHELFGFDLNHTDDFQKYRFDHRPSGTDYVAFNTTACVALAIIRAVETGKLHSDYAGWIAPHLCTWAEQICFDRLPTPARFSYIHQTLSCLLAAVDLHSERNCIPNKIRMNIFPRVFSKHSFAPKIKQGFYVTPFNFPTEWMMPKNSDQLFTDFRAACKDFCPTLELVRGDHSPQGVITERIWQYINESKFLIALCVGANANVYYEIGVAHTLGKPVMLVGRKNANQSGDNLASKTTEADFKFDIAGVHHVELEVRDFQLHEIQSHVTQFLTKVYGQGKM